MKLLIIILIVIFLFTIIKKFYTRIRNSLAWKYTDQIVTESLMVIIEYCLY